VGDAGVCELRGLNRLQRLGLAGCAGIGNGALGAVAAMTALRELNLEWCSVGDKGARSRAEACGCA
jgi:hypothetical protein